MKEEICAVVRFAFSFMLSFSLKEGIQTGPPMGMGMGMGGPPIGFGGKTGLSLYFFCFMLIVLIGPPPGGFGGIFSPQYPTFSKLQIKQDHHQVSQDLDHRSSSFPLIQSSS